MNSVYVLPRSEDGLEDFQWIAQQAVAGGSEAWVCEADFNVGSRADETETRAALVGRTWVTRAGVQIDRIAQVVREKFCNCVSPAGTPTQEACTREWLVSFGARRVDTNSQ